MAKAEIYYWKSIKKLLETGYEKKYPDLNKLNEEYVKLPIEFEEEDMDEIFSILNSDKNPMGTIEMQQWIKNNGLKHTSMSVGDIIKSDKGFYVCEDIGWKRLDECFNIEGKEIHRKTPKKGEITFK